MSAETLLGRFTDSYTMSMDQAILGSTFANPYSLFLQSSGKSSVRLGSGAVTRALEKSSQRLGTSNIELYQIESIGLLSGYVGGNGALASGLASALERGACNYVGVSNAGPGTLKRFQRLMEKRGEKLTTNQFEFSLTKRKAWKNGTIKACKDLGIIPIAYKPFDNGLASGKYTANNPTGGVVGGRVKFNFQQVLEPLKILHDTQIEVAAAVKVRLKKEARSQDQRSKKFRNPAGGNNANREITPLQVAVNYIVAKGAVPVPEIKNKKEAEELLGCLGWGLNDNEVAMLDKAADVCGY